MPVIKAWVRTELVRGLKTNGTSPATGMSFTFTAPPEPDASVLRGLTAAAMADPVGEADKSALRLDFSRVGEARRARRRERLATQELSRQACGGQAEQ